MHAPSFNTSLVEAPAFYTGGILWNLFLEKGSKERRRNISVTMLVWNCLLLPISWRIVCNRAFCSGGDLPAETVSLFRSPSNGMNENGYEYSDRKMYTKNYYGGINNCNSFLYIRKGDFLVYVVIFLYHYTMEYKKW